jgi:hypothetical protein
VVTILAGILMRLTDPDSFPSIWAGLWWAIQTTTTVGYGDLVPGSLPGRLIATLVMLGGIGFISVTTAGITTAFVESARRRRGARASAPGGGPHGRGPRGAGCRRPERFVLSVAPRYRAAGGRLTGVP